MSYRRSPANGRRRHIGRTLAFALLYPSYVVAFVVAVVYLAFWRPYYANLADRQPYELDPPRYVDMPTMRRLGALRADPEFEDARDLLTKVESSPRTPMAAPARPAESNAVATVSFEELADE